MNGSENIEKEVFHMVSWRKCHSNWAYRTSVISAVEVRERSFRGKRKGWARAYGCELCSRVAILVWWECSAELQKQDMFSGHFISDPKLFSFIPKGCLLHPESPRPSGGMLRGMRSHSVFWDVCALEEGGGIEWTLINMIIIIDPLWRCL